MELFGVSNFKKKIQREADSATSLIALTRDGIKARAKESALPARGLIFSRLRLIESEANPVPDTQNPSRFRVVLIQEGLGNFGDCHYYTRQALEQAVIEKIFEGKKCFADHPDAIEEQVQPERKVTDIIGHFENVAFQVGSDGRGQIVGDLVVLAGAAYDWVRALLTHALAYAAKYPDQDFVGLSINANGDASEVGIDQFLRDYEIPESVKPKLAAAQDQGATTVKPVTQLTSAVSCDLVTEAGAGGKIAQMLEQEKARMAKKKEGEIESKKTEGADPKENKKEAGEGTDPAPGAPGAEDPNHPDAAQDEELIRQMLLQYLGDGHDDDTVQTAKEAYEAYKEMGMDEKEAMEAAGNSMKLAKHMAAKGAAGPVPPAAKPAAPAPGAPAPQGGAAPSEPHAETCECGECKEKKEAGGPESLAAEAKKESAKVMKLTAEVATLKEKIRKYELEGCEGALDKMLRESKLPMHATKLFRETAGALRSEAEAKEKFRIFHEAFRAKGGEADLLENFVINPEKQTSLRESGGLDLSTCVKDQ